jgi:hypothetical protein
MSHFVPKNLIMKRCNSCSKDKIYETGHPKQNSKYNG